MKKQDVQKKQFRQLSDEELEKVNGGSLIELPEECVDPEYQCSHPEVCKFKCRYTG